MVETEAAGENARPRWGAREQPTALREDEFVGDRSARFQGAVLGAAIGEALGNSVRSRRWAQIRADFGPRGVTELDPVPNDARLLDGGLLLALAADGLVRADRVRPAASDASSAHHSVPADNSHSVEEMVRTLDSWAGCLAPEGRARGPGGWLARQLMPEGRADLLLGSNALRQLRDRRSQEIGGSDGVLDALFLAVPMGIWSANDSVLLDFVWRTLQATGETGDMVVTGMATAVLVQQNIATGHYARAFDQVEMDFEALGLSRSPTLDAMNAGLALAHQAITPDEIETLGHGDTPASALAIAACAVRSAHPSFDEALRIAVNHSGDSAATGALAGAIAGASSDGVHGIGGRWADGLAGAGLLFRLAQDMCEQFGPWPRDDAEWRARYPLSLDSGGGAAPDTGSTRRPERAAQAVLGFATGLGLGDTLATAVRGRTPVRLADASGDLGLAIFALDGMIRGHARQRATGEDDPVVEVGEAYARREEWRRFAVGDVEPQAADHGFLRQWLNEITGRDRQSLAGLTAEPTSAACLAPAAMAALWSPDAAVVRDIAVRIAALTHHDPVDQASAAAFAAFVHQVIEDPDPLRALDAARASTTGLPGGDLVATMIEQVKRRILDHQGNVPLEEVRRFGDSGTSLGMLARVFATLHVEGEFSVAVHRLVAESGNFATATALHTALVGALSAGADLPTERLDDAPLARLLGALAVDATKEFGPEPPEDEDWAMRYPLSAPPENGPPENRPPETVAEQKDDISTQARTTGPVRKLETRVGVTALGKGGLSEQRRNRVVGAVLGFAIGDRLGAPVEELSWPRIQEQYGNRGIDRPGSGSGPASSHGSDRLRSSSVMLALSLDTVIKADRVRVSGETPDLGLDLVRECQSVAAALAARERPAFSNHVVAEAAWRHQLEPHLDQALIRPPRSADHIVRYLPLALWTEVYPQSFTLAREAALAASVEEEDATAIAAFVVMLQQCIVTTNPPRAFGTAEAELNKLGNTAMGSALAQALRIAREGVTPEEIEQLGSGNTAAEAVAIAVCAAESAPHQFDEALSIAVNHSGNSALTGGLCGALMAGSFAEWATFPVHWLDDLTGAEMLSRLAQDACDQLSPTPRDDPEWRQHYPIASDPKPTEAGPIQPGAPDPRLSEAEPPEAGPSEPVSPRSVSERGEPVRRPQPHQPPDAHERFLGAMLAGAVGDTLGYAVEFHDIDMIRRHHGDSGLTDPVLWDGLALVSDDTQMMLFTLEGLIRAHVARRITPSDNDPLPELQHAYQRWFHTQNQPWERAAGPYVRQLTRPDGWLITNEGLFNVRAPGNTCMSALANFARTHQHATPAAKINDSNGCGGVVRTAPVAVWSNDPDEVFHAAADTAALTHSHPSGFLPAGVLAVIVHQVLREVSLADSVRLARELLVRWPGHEEQAQALDKAVELAKRGPVRPEELTHALGHGWGGAEALAIGLYAVMATDTVRDALLLSVNHSGDSDSTGTVCGNIAGAVHGGRAIPHQWLSVLELHDVIRALAQDALAEFSPAPPTEAAWRQRYPAW